MKTSSPPAQQPTDSQLSTLNSQLLLTRSTLPVTVRHPTDLPPTDSQLSTLNSQLILDFTASDESLDRYGEIITASGWKLDAYRRNPVFLNSHQYGDIIFTLGKALITEIRGNTLFQRIQFAVDINPFAKIAAELYANGYLRAVSPGFIPLRWLDPPPQRDAPPPFRRKYLEQELLEVSAVGIPANPNALALTLQSGALHKSHLQDLLDFCHHLLSSKTSSSTLSPPLSEPSSKPSSEPLSPPAKQPSNSQLSTLNSQLRLAQQPSNSQLSTLNSQLRLAQQPSNSQLSTRQSGSDLPPPSTSAKQPSNSQLSNGQSGSDLPPPSTSAKQPTDSQLSTLNSQLFHLALTLRNTLKNC